jgi:hypothetical protein
MTMEELRAIIERDAEHRDFPWQGEVDRSALLVTLRNVLQLLCDQGAGGECYFCKQHGTHAVECPVHLFDAFP